MKKFFRKIAQFAAILIAVSLVGTMANTASGRGGRGGGRGGGGRGGGGRGGGGRGGGRSGGGRSGGSRGRVGRGGGGGGTGGVGDRRAVAQDLEDLRLQTEKEERITDARKSGAENAFDEMQDQVLDEERERTSAARRAEWRSRANPG